MELHILWIVPHSNVRYRASLVRLAKAELAMALGTPSDTEAVSVCEIAGHTCLRFDFDEKDNIVKTNLSRLSSAYMFCREGENGALYPELPLQKAYLGDDISGILKYKGKTNESFTHFLLNAARFSGAFAGSDKPLDVLDPVCGKGTTLLEAVNAGDNAFGIDVDAKALSELEVFFKKYCEYHKFKHTVNESSLTLGGEPAPMWRFSFAPDAAAFKAGDRREIAAALCDTNYADSLPGKKRFHIIAGDLPYGVQHAPHASGKKLPKLEVFTHDAIAVWAKALLPGGAMALSFNTYTIRRDVIRQAMADAGLQVCAGGVYDEMEHWVEQAVSRDIAVAVKL